MDNIKNRLIALGYEENQADKIIKFYQKNDRLYSLCEYLVCMEACNCQSTDIDECLTTCY